jgi:trehalose 6-phosphate synthase/phosphatase
VPSRTDVLEYQDLKEEIDLLVGRLNGKFSFPKWLPILYMYGGISQDQLAGYYKESAVAFITPLRDGNSFTYS